MNQVHDRLLWIFHVALRLLWEFHERLSPHMNLYLAYAPLWAFPAALESPCALVYVALGLPSCNALWQWKFGEGLCFTLPFWDPQADS